MDENKRGSFGSTIGFLLSAIGSAVGLGNIWGLSLIHISEPTRP